MHTADIVIIGGGIVGSSIAYHLTGQGCKNVLVIERESAQGKGSTGKSMGGVRAQFATPVNIQMSLYSIPFYAHFEETLGHPSGYQPQGYLFVATRQAHLDYLQTNFQQQKALGLKTAQMIEAEEIIRMPTPCAARSVIKACTSDLAPTSIPWVGSSRINTEGFVTSHRLSATFC